MPNSDISAWIPELWAQEVLRHLKAYLALGRLVNRDYSADVQQAGDTVNVPLPPTLAAQDKAAGASITFTGVAANTTPVVLNKHKVSAFQMDDIAVMQSKPQAVASYGRAAAIALAEAIESDLLAEYANAAGSVGTAGTDADRATMLAARTVLANAKVPQNDSRFAFLSTKDYEQFLESLSTSNAGAMFNQREELRLGRVGSLYGFDAFETQLAPVVAGTPNTTHGLAGHRDAITLVTRPLTAPPAGAGVVASTVTDADIQMTMRVLMSYNHTTMQQQVTFDVLYGIKTVRPEWLVDILS